MAQGSPRPSSAPKSTGIASKSASSEVANSGPSTQKEVGEQENDEARTDHERTLLLSGLPPGITNEELRDLCGIHGTIVSACTSDKRWGGRVATVRYKDSESARTAAELMHGHVVLGAKLSVEVGASPGAASTVQRQQQTTKSRAVCRDSASAADAEQHSQGAVTRKRRLEGSDGAAYSGAEASRTKASHITGDAKHSSKPVFRPSQPKDSSPKEEAGAVGPVKASIAAHSRRPQSEDDKESSGVTTGSDEADIFDDEFFARVDERMNKCLDADGKLKEDVHGSTSFPPEPPQDFSGVIDHPIPRDRSKPSSRTSIRRVRPHLALDSEQSPASPRLPPPQERRQAEIAARQALQEGLRQELHEGLGRRHEALSHTGSGTAEGRSRSQLSQPTRQPARRPCSMQRRLATVSDAANAVGHSGAPSRR